MPKIHNFHQHSSLSLCDWLKNDTISISTALQIFRDAISAHTLQFSSRQYLRTLESPYALHPVSQEFPQCCLKEVIERFLFLCLSPPGDRRCDVLGFVPCRLCLKLLKTSDLPRCKPPVMVAFPTSLSAPSFPLTRTCPAQYTHRHLTQARDTHPQAPDTG